MEEIFTTSREIDAIILNNMEILFRYPGTDDSGKNVAKDIYRVELAIFSLSDLKSGWKRVIQTHKSPWWPTIATLLSACRAEFLLRSLSTLGRPLPPAKRHAWARVKRQFYLKAASNGFSRTSTDHAMSEADKWIRNEIQGVRRGTDE